MGCYMENKGQVNKEDILYLHFHINQKFNERPIKKRDRRGRTIRLVSLGFPYQSKFEGCYISVNSAFVTDDKFNTERQQISILANTPFKIYRYNYKTRRADEVWTLTGKEVNDEFNAWQLKQEIKDEFIDIHIENQRIVEMSEQYMAIFALNESKFKGCYFIAERNSFEKKQDSSPSLKTETISIKTATKYKVYRYDRIQQKTLHVCTMLGKEINENFNSYQCKKEISNDMENEKTEEPDITDEY